MKKIIMTKYGFVRWPEEDFSDDGNRFMCYRAGKKVRVSKLVSDGEAYLSIGSQVGNGTLPYEEYSKLPHYNDANWKWNGVSVASLTDKDLIDFYTACMLYEMEYEEAEAKIVYPTLEEIRDKASRITTHRLLELSKAENMINRNLREAITQFTPYEWRTVQEYFNNLVAATKRFDIATYPKKIVGTAHSFKFVQPEYEMGESYYFWYIKKLFAKYDLN